MHTDRPPTRHQHPNQTRYLGRRELFPSDISSLHRRITISLTQKAALLYSKKVIKFLVISRMKNISLG